MNHSTDAILYFLLLVIFPRTFSAEDVDGADSPTEFERSFLKFEEFRREFKKNYATPQEALNRFYTFKDNLRRISELNRAERGTAVYGITDMSDWTPNEFWANRANLRPTINIPADESKAETGEGATEDIDDDPTTPLIYDWRFEGAVTPVKNQAKCGACWAFAAVGNIENLYAIKYGNLSTFSEQQLIDCDDEESGCDGAGYDLVQTVVSSIIEKGGLDTEDGYPYEAQDGICRFNSDEVGVQVARVNELDALDEKAMAKYISSTSSTVNFINAAAMQHYKGGIIDAVNLFCRKRDLNHAVLAVGYGVHARENGKKSIPYWVMKNSWGENWGENGFFRIKRGSNVCGLAYFISSIVLA